MAIRDFYDSRYTDWDLVISLVRIVGEEKDGVYIHPKTNSYFNT